MVELRNILHNTYMKYSFKRTDEYSTWLNKQTKKSQAQIEKRLSAIEVNGHFGDDKDLSEGLAELRWANGRRIYYTLAVDDSGEIVVLLLGGNKNGQSKDITKARKIQRSFYPAG